MPETWGATASPYGRWLAALDGFGQGETIEFESLPDMTDAGHGVSMMLAEKASAALRVRLERWSRDLGHRLARTRHSLLQAEAAIVTGRRELDRIRELARCPLLFQTLRDALSQSIEATVAATQKSLLELAAQPGPQREQTIRLVRRTLLTSTAVHPIGTGPDPTGAAPPLRRMLS